MVCLWKGDIKGVPDTSAGTTDLMESISNHLGAHCDRCLPEKIFSVLRASNCPPRLFHEDGSQVIADLSRRDTSSRCTCDHRSGVRGHCSVPD